MLGIFRLYAYNLDSSGCRNILLKIIILIHAMKMHNTLQRRLAAVEAERVAAEKAKLEREASAQKSLREQELSLEVVKNHSKSLEQQAQENAKVT